MDSATGIFLFAVAGLFSASFYTPLKFVKWRWELMWIFYSISALIIAPMLIATIAIPSCWQAFQEVEGSVLIWTFIFGAMWGVGGLTFGLSMRYLGIGLGTAVALGVCSLAGALVDPIKNGTLLDMASTKGGFTVLIGLFICTLGIAINGVAGMLKEKDLALAKGNSDDSKSEFSLIKGFTVAIFAGVMSAGMSISLTYGEPIAVKAKIIAETTMNIPTEQATLFQNSAILIVTLIGGFIVNFFWCLFLCVKGGAFGDFKKVSGGKNIFFVLLCTLGGLLWYCQFFIFGMGKTKLNPEYVFAAWPMLMAFIIVFAGIIGLLLGEWKGSSALTKTVLWLGILVLGASTFVMS